MKEKISEDQIKVLNQKYAALSPEDRIKSLYLDFDENEIMLTSSFATTSAYLLKLFSEIHNAQQVHFIDTGYHFEETLIYKDYLTKLYDLNVVDVQAEKKKHLETKAQSLWKTDPNECCNINKVEPLENIKEQYSVWVSGLMAWQNEHRSALHVFEMRGELLKFYPLIDVTREEREKFIVDHHLPFHPLMSKGYFSVGCTHCTVPGKGRDGRWNNNPKTECGLHL